MECRAPREVNRLWFEVLHQIPLVCQKVLLVYFSIMIEEILYRPHIRCNGVLGEISLCQMIFEFCYHTTLIYNEYSNNIREYIEHDKKLPEGWAMCRLE